MDVTLTILTPAVIAAIVSGLISVALPWANWGVEKRRLKRARRISQIDSIRSLYWCKSSIEYLIQAPEYAALRAHFEPKLVHKIESHSLTIQNGGRSKGVNNFWPEVLDDLARLERLWDLA